MRVAVISDSRRKGGAALATARVFDELAKTENFDVRWFVSQADGSQDDRTVVFAAGGVVRRAVQTLFGKPEPWKRRVLRWWSRFRNRRNLLRLICEFQPDVISLHSINEWTDAAVRRTIACDLAGIAPVVWTLHDMWPLTGYSDYPAEYLDPVVPDEIAFKCVFDQTASRHEAQAIMECREQLVFVAPSQWIGQLANKVFENKVRVKHIPHGVNLTEFRPLPRQEARRWLDLPDKDQPVIAAAATNLSARRKGMKIFVEALRLLDRAVTVALFGGATETLDWPLHVRAAPLGFLSDTRLLRAAYSAADVFVLPSLAEMFGLVLIEAMACGTPCVGFKTGGIPEIIRHGKTGYLAVRGSSEDLASAIKRLLDQNSEEKDSMRRSCRRLAEEEYDLQQEVRGYSELFAELACKG